MTDVAAIFDWIRTNSSVLWLLPTLSLFMFVGTLAALPWLVARIPEDYFLRPERSPWDSYGRHPVLCHLLLVVRNLVGISFILVGFVILFLPGQGIITILIGLLLTTFPGKRRIVVRIVRQKNVLETLNWMRRKAHRPPLRLPSSGEEER